MEHTNRYPILTAKVFDSEANELYSSNVTFDSPIAVEQFDTASTGEPYYTFDPAEAGNVYTFELTASIEGHADENPANDGLAYTTSLSHNIYAHDQGNITGSWSSCNYTTGCVDGDIIGVTYPFFVSTVVNNIEFYVSSMTEVGTGYVAKLMIFDEGSSAWVEVASSTYVSIDSEEEVGVMHTAQMTDAYYIDVPKVNL
jgi:hypothetical protein